MADDFALRRFFDPTKQRKVLNGIFGAHQWRDVVVAALFRRYLMGSSYWRIVTTVCLQFDKMVVYLFVMEVKLLPLFDSLIPPVIR